MATNGLRLKLKDGGKVYAALCGDRVLRRAMRTQTSASEYAAIVARRLERWKHVDPMVMSLPIGFHDKITNELVIQFGWTERLKLLFGYKLRLRMSILCANRPGRVASSEELDLLKPEGRAARRVEYVRLEQESALSHSHA